MPTWCRKSAAHNRLMSATRQQRSLRGIRNTARPLAKGFRSVRRASALQQSGSRRRSGRTEYRVGYERRALMVSLRSLRACQSTMDETMMAKIGSSVRKRPPESQITPLDRATAPEAAASPAVSSRTARTPRSSSPIRSSAQAPMTSIATTEAMHAGSP